MIGISFEDGTNLVTLVMQMPQSLSYLHSYIDQFAEGCFLKGPNCLANLNDLGNTGNNLGNVEMNLGKAGKELDIDETAP
jgi:hypothetical protein